MGGGSGLRMEDVSRVVLERGGGFGFSLLPAVPPLMESLGGDSIVKCWLRFWLEY